MLVQVAMLNTIQIATIFIQTKTTKISTILTITLAILEKTIDNLSLTPMAMKIEMEDKSHHMKKESIVKIIIIN